MNIVKEEGEKKLGKILYYKFHDKLFEEEKKCLYSNRHSKDG